jgi:acyl carrier protein
MTDPTALKRELKIFIVRRLRLSDVSPDSIGDADPLIGGGLDLDSVDLLDLVVGVEKEYGVRIASVADGKEILASVNALAEHILKKRASAS